MLIFKTRAGVRVVGYLGVAAALRRKFTRAVLGYYEPLNVTMWVNGTRQSVRIHHDNTLSWEEPEGIYTIGLKALADSGHNVEIIL